MASIIKCDKLLLPDGSTPTAADLGIVLSGADVPDQSTIKTQCAARTTQHSLAGDSGWVDHISMTFTVTRDGSDALFIYNSSSSYESGPVQGFARLMLNGGMLGMNACVAKQSTANSAGSGCVIWDKQYLPAGTHTVTVQIRNTISGSTWVTPYWSADGQTANTLSVMYYGK